MEAMSSKGAGLEPENEGNLDNKKTTVTSKLQKRDDQRLADLQKRKEIKESTEAKNESADFFLENFNSSKLDVESSLEKSDLLEKPQLSDHFDNIVISLQKLQKFLTDSTIFLPSYEVQKAQEVINKLQTSASEKREELLPKKKFAFRSKKKGEKSAKPVNTEKVEKKEINLDITECSFADLQSQTLQKDASDINGKDVALARLADCKVYFKGSPGTLHMDNLTSCQVFCGPVSGSIFIDGCKDCTFVVGCQQLRIHSTTESHFYIHVTSKAIIEDCSSVQFAPYNWQYGELDEHYSYSGLDRNRNNWDDVDDFNWLASDKRSPHWDVLPDDKRVTKWA